MKRFVTYLYEYENGHKTKNAGFLRVDIRNQMVSIQVNIRYPELANEMADFYIIVRDGNAYSIRLGELQMKEGHYQGTVSCRYQSLGESPYTFSDAVGVGIQCESGCYLASSWKDEEDEVIARGAFVVYGSPAVDETEIPLESKEVEDVDCSKEKGNVDLEEHMEAASIQIAEDPTCDLVCEEALDQDTYRKINLNEIATLPSNHWYFSNNSFLIHGFWNYGYLVLKETMEAGKKKLSLGVPGIFEQPEMVMATYFGFPTFQALPPQVVEMVMGETCQTAEKEKKQEPKVGTFGCWFVNL